jgi:hypothetical protein
MAVLIIQVGGISYFEINSHVLIPARGRLHITPGEIRRELGLK